VNVGFYLDLHTEQYLWLAKKSAIRARNKIPDAKLTLLTVTGFPTTIDSSYDKVIRLDLPPDCFYGFKKCYAQSVVQGEWLFLDVDCIVQKDVTHVFNSQFDQALCLRYFSKLVEKNPFNGGISFSKNPEFWKEVAGRPEHHKSPSDTEKRFCEVAMNDKYVIRCLNGDLYNYSPKQPEEDLSGKYVVHYKGDRKNWLYDRARDAV
jgi:hypothetical protein